MHGLKQKQWGMQIQTHTIKKINKFILNRTDVYFELLYLICIFYHNYQLSSSLFPYRCIFI